MAATTSSARTIGFQAEVKQLLHLMVHSLYSEREIFLRELISNASDANDKLRFEAIAEPSLLSQDPALTVRITVDKDAGTLTVTDDGIGMSEDEVIENLGTIAHSGTGRFVERLTGDQRSDSKLIGQFGVGFYSAFIVADEVTVETRRAGLGAESGVRWVSDGRGEFTVEPITRAARGTMVHLKIKDDAREFLDEHRIRALVRKYSDHIDFPVLLSEPGGGEPAVLNHAQALWTRSRSSIKDDEYVEFYRHVTHDFAEPLCWSHNRVEGKREYTNLLYIPAVAPFDLWNREAPKGLKLYVKRVFITDHATNFLPLYLRFVRGVVDASDLSLNVSRELLQHDPHVGAIRAALTKRVLDMIGKLAKDEPEKFVTFWRQFGNVLKEGLAEDPSNKERIASLLRFHSTASTGDEAGRSLEAYVEAAGEKQDKIFYLVADSLAAARSSPHLEIFRDRGIEVLLLVDRVDEWMVQYLSEFSGKTLKDVARGELGLDAAQESAKTTAGKEADRVLMQRLKALLGERVGEVRASSRLKQSAACLVLGEHDLGFQMRQVLRAAGHDAPESVPDLELNVAHPLIRRLAREEEDADFDRLGRIVFDQAVLAEGRQLDDPAAYMRRLDEFLLKLGLDNDASSAK